MNKITSQNDNADARASARQSVYKLCVEWQDVQNSLTVLQPAKYSSDDYDRTNLLKVCFYGDFSALKILESGGIDIHQKDEEALRFAARGGQTEMVGYLFDNGADIHAVGDSALRLAAKRGYFEIVDFLTARGANTNKLTAEEHEAYDAYKTKRKMQQDKLAVIHKVWQDEKNITAIFNPKIWTGHTNEMLELWNEIPQALQVCLDFPHLVAQVQHESLRKNKKKPVFVR
jgi:hypothetical protein